MWYLCLLQSSQQQYLAGLAMSLQAGRRRSASLPSPKPTQRIRTPLLTLSVSNSRLNPHERLNARNAKQWLRAVG